MVEGRAAIMSKMEKPAAIQHLDHIVELSCDGFQTVLIPTDNEHVGAPSYEFAGELAANAARCTGQQHAHILEPHATALRSGRREAACLSGNSRKIWA